MSFISKVELKCQLEKMGIKVEGNYIRKRDLKKIIATDDEFDDLGKIHLISISSEICEDDYHKGEGKNTGAGLQNEKIGKMFQSAKEMFKWLADNYGLDADSGSYELMGNDEIQTDKSGIADHSDKQNGGWMDATDKEVELWKKGKLKLYVEHYFIKIMTKHHF